MKKVIDTLNKYLSTGDVVIACISGGPDSMCLLSLLEKIKDLNIILAHVNHKVRKESDDEEKYLRKYAKDHNMTFELLTITDYSSDNFEAEARKKRYIFFNELLNKYKAKYIITAHHGDDLVETILMRLSRGSSLSGYAGIVYEDGKYLRPLLLTTKDEIIKYNKDNNITYFNDYTNDEDDHTRNRYRHKILPLLKKENPKLHEKYFEFSKELNECDKYLKRYIESLNVIKDNYIDIKRFLELDEFIQRKIIEDYIGNIQKTRQFEVSKKTVEDILKVIKNNKSNIKYSLKDNLIAKKAYNKFEIIVNTLKEDYEEVFSHSFQNNMFKIKEVSKEEKNDNYVIRLNSKEIMLPLIIRNKREKDVIDVKNLGHKKVKDIFIDCKIDIDERSSWPIVTDSNGIILWIPGIKKSKFVKDKNEKYDIILSSERKSGNE